MQKEVRHLQIDEIRTQKTDDEVLSFSGYVVKFGEPSEDLGFIEYVDRNAFTNTLADENKNIFALYNHDWDKPIASVRNGSLELSVDDTGLAFTITPKANTTYLRDVIELVNSGELQGMSFGFRVLDDEWETRDGKDVRTLKDIDLFEVTLTANPAYQSSEVVCRSHEEYKEQAQRELDKQNTKRKLLLELDLS